MAQRETASAALLPGGGLAQSREVVLVPAHDVGDHDADVRILGATGLLQGRDLIFELWSKLPRDPALLRREARAAALLLDPTAHALETGGELFGILRHQPADLLGAIGARRRRAERRSDQDNTARKPDEHRVPPSGWVTKRTPDGAQCRWNGSSPDPH